MENMIIMTVKSKKTVVWSPHICYLGGGSTSRVAP